MSRLEEIQARVDAATPQPWTVTYYAAHDEPCDRHDGATHVSYVTGPEDAWVLWPGYVGDDAIVAVMPADLALIAAAPDDVRWLLARVRALEKGLELLAYDYNWEPGDYGTVWTYQADDGDRPSAQEIARATLAGEAPVGWR